MYATLSLPFVDAEQRNPSGPGDGNRVSTSARFAIAFVALAVVWQLVRVLVR